MPKAILDEGISALQEAYASRFGAPMSPLGTQDPQMQQSANISMPGSAPGQPQLGPVQDFISMQAEQPVPEREEVEQARAKKQPDQTSQAAFVAEIIRQLATQDQAPVPSSVPGPAQLPAVI